MRSHNKISLTTIVCTSLLIAMSIILTRFLSIQTQFLRIGFGIIPVAIAGIAFGPVWGAVCGTISDISGMLIYPSGPYFPGFTLTAALTGLVFGLFLYRRHFSFIRLFIVCTAVCLGLNLLLDTLWLSIMYGSGYMVLLPARLIKCALNIPVYAILLEVIWGKALSKIPQLRSI